LCGWHVFFGDVGTGGNTLVCRITDADKVRLRQLQAEVIRELAPLRDVATTEAWLAPRLPRHMPAERDSIRRCGAPFTGDLWQPHFTVASIRPDAWDAVWSRLEQCAPVGRFRCPHLHLSQIHQDRPPTLLASAPFA